MFGNKTDNKHAEMVRALAKPGQAIIDELDPDKAHILHMVVGISGEAGELLDAIKKATIYNKPLDVENVIEELGDLEFYMQGLRDKLGISREQTLQGNLDKLAVRYAKGKYSNEQAQSRDDKKGEQ